MTARVSAIPPQKTHKISFECRRLCYAWHPWYDRSVLTRAATGAHADLAYFCKLAEAPVDAMLVEIPRWMFDASHCAAMRLAELASVDWRSLEALNALITARRNSVEGR
jgi:hypothetical protein